MRRKANRNVSREINMNVPAVSYLKELKISLSFNRRRLKNEEWQGRDGFAEQISRFAKFMLYIADVELYLYCVTSLNSE